MKEKELEVRTTFITNKIRGTYELAMYLVKKYEMITIGRKDREVYVYDKGYYYRAENEVISPEMQRVLGDLITGSAITETFKKIYNATAKTREIFEQAYPRYIPLKNGVYDITTKQLLPHSHDYKFRHQFPIQYDATATCPKIETFFNQVFTEIQRTTIEEWIGYCFYRNYQYKKAIIIVGEGDTGKTTFLELLTSFIGEQNRSGVSLHKLSVDKFSAAQLSGKHVNIFDELSADDIHDTANFKIATGGGSVMGEYKFGDQFSFKNYSKLTFACNKIPDVSDVSDEAYFNRWMVISLEKTIEKKISNFIATLTTEEELSGLFNLAMKGLERLLEQDGFSYKNSGIDTKLEMMQSNSIARFCLEGIYKDQGAEISKEDFFEAYEIFCDKNNLSTETMIMVGRKLMFYAQYISDGQIAGSRNGMPAQVKGWRNVSIKKTPEQLAQIEEQNAFYQDLTSVKNLRIIPE